MLLLFKWTQTQLPALSAAAPLLLQQLMQTLPVPEHNTKRRRLTLHTSSKHDSYQCLGMYGRLIISQSHQMQFVSSIICITVLLFYDPIESLIMLLVWIGLDNKLTAIHEYLLYVLRLFLKTLPYFTKELWTNKWKNHKSILFAWRSTEEDRVH